MRVFHGLFKLPAPVLQMQPVELVRYQGTGSTGTFPTAGSTPTDRPSRIVPWTRVRPHRRSCPSGVKCFPLPTSGFGCTDRGFPCAPTCGGFFQRSSSGQVHPDRGSENGSSESHGWASEHPSGFHLNHMKPPHLAPTDMPDPAHRSLPAPAPARRRPERRRCPRLIEAATTLGLRRPGASED